MRVGSTVTVIGCFRKWCLIRHLSGHPSVVRKLTALSVVGMLLMVNGMVRRQN